MLFLIFGPRIVRTLAFNLALPGSALAGLFRWVFGKKRPKRTSRRACWKSPPSGWRSSRACWTQGEELWEYLPGWKRSSGGPRRTWLLLTSRRLLWIEARLFGKSRAQSLDYHEIIMARHRNLYLLSRAEILTHRHENFSLTVACNHLPFASQAVQIISLRAGIDLQTPPPAAPQAAPRLATLQP